MLDIFKCEVCETEEEVTICACPYQRDVNGKLEVVKLCDNCYKQMCSDI